MWTNCIWKAQGREKHVANIYVIFLSIYNLKEFVEKKMQHIVLPSFSSKLEQKIGFC